MQRLREKLCLPYSSDSKYYNVAGVHKGESGRGQSRESSRILAYGES